MPVLGIAEDVPTLLMSGCEKGVVRTRVADELRDGRWTHNIRTGNKVRIDRMADDTQPHRPADWPGLVLLCAMLIDAFDTCEAQLRKRERRQGPFAIGSDGLRSSQDFGLQWDFEVGGPIAAVESECGFDPPEDLEVLEHSENQDVLFGFMKEPELVMHLLMPLANHSIDWEMSHSSIQAGRTQRVKFGTSPPEGWPDPLELELVHPGFALAVQFPKRARVLATLSTPCARPSYGALVWTTEFVVDWDELEGVSSDDLNAKFWDSLRQQVSGVVPTL